MRRRFHASLRTRHKTIRGQKNKNEGGLLYSMYLYPEPMDGRERLTHSLPFHGPAF